MKRFVVFGLVATTTVSVSNRYWNHRAQVESNRCYCEAEHGHKNKREFSQYPLRKPYREGFLKVSPIHTIYYHLYGNPNGKNVLVVHGGPGGSSKPAMATYFDPECYNIILVDQRGCGKSTPFAEITENNTMNLVEDFEKLRQELGVRRWQLFGGSWGSTLALTYAITYPQHVSEIIIRGIFLGRRKEIEWMYEGKGANFIFPLEWEVFASFIPGNERNNMVEAYRKRLNGEFGEDVMLEACWRWAYWESQICQFHQRETTRFEFDKTEARKYLPIARIENHYAYHNIFFPKDNFLLDPRNIERIKDIPIRIVQGRYDVVCPPISAFELHKQLPNSKLTYTLSGHSAREKEIIDRLIRYTEEFKSDSYHISE